jgi:hypothetical protein
MSALLGKWTGGPAGRGLPWMRIALRLRPAHGPGLFKLLESVRICASYRLIVVVVVEASPARQDDGSAARSMAKVAGAADFPAVGLPAS